MNAVRATNFISIARDRESAGVERISQNGNGSELISRTRTVQELTV